MRRAAGLQWGAPAMLAGLALAACDAPFEPFEESDREISAFGFLDASADTQWIRVTPPRHSVFTTPDPLGMTVTLQHVTSGRTVELRDSVVRFEGANVEGAVDLFAHNFWTTEPIEPGATYAVTVSGAERAPAGATLPIPEDYGVSVTYSSRDTAFAHVRNHTVEQLALVIFRRNLPPGCEGWNGPPWYHADRSEIDPPVSGTYTVPVTSDLGFRYDFPCPLIGEDLLVVASGNPWPDDPQSATSALGVIDAPHDIDGGFGFLGGVFSKAIPWEPCRVEPLFRPGCTLVYDSTSVTLAGTVTDARTGARLRDAELRLTEILPDSQVTRFRGSTDSRGSFELGAVPAGVSHVFRVSHPRTCFDNTLAPPVFLDRLDTLRAYAPAEPGTVHVVLERNPACSES